MQVSPSRAGWLSRFAALRTLTLIAAIASPALAGLPDTTREQLTNLLGSLPRRTQVALVVQDPRSGDVIYDHNGRLPLKPASVMKLVTTAAALDWFDPNMTLRTNFYTHEGELWILGGGDPGLGDERLARRRGTTPLAFVDAIAKELKARKIAQIDKVVVDDSIFDHVNRHSDWDVNQWDRWYAAPVGGVILMNNCVELRATVSGSKISTQCQPALPATFFENKLKVGKQHKPSVRRRPDSDIFEFIGPIKRSDSFGYVSVGRPGPFVGHALATALRQRGITVSSNVVRRVLSRQACQSATLIHTHKTTLEEAVWRCNTHSQNLFAEALLKSLAALNPDGSRSGDQGSWPSGIERLRNVLKAMGVNARLATFRDGSGLSHGNRVTGRMIAELLVAMDNHPQRDLFRRSLAQPGQSGTLRSKRYGGLEGKLQGKTGSINGVRTLAGYAGRPEGYDVTFAMLINGHLPNDFRARVVKALTR